MKKLISILLLLLLFTSCGTKTEEVPGSLTSEIVELKDYTVELDFLYEIEEGPEGEAGELVFLTSSFEEINEDGRRCFHRISPGSLSFVLDEVNQEGEWKRGMTLQDEGNNFGFISASGKEPSIHHKWVRESDKFKTVLDLRAPRYGKLQFTCKSL